jgi:hypothetical protein
MQISPTPFLVTVKSHSSDPSIASLRKHVDGEWKLIRLLPNALSSSASLANRRCKILQQLVAISTCMAFPHWFFLRGTFIVAILGNPFTVSLHPTKGTSLRFETLYYKSAVMVFDHILYFMSIGAAAPLNITVLAPKT